MSIQSSLHASFVSSETDIALCCMIYVLCSVIFSVVGCGVFVSSETDAGQSTDALFAAANSQLASAQKAGAERLAESGFEEARALFAEAEIALENGDKEARTLIQKAHTKARLAEALARQARAETEVVQLEAELEKASAEASRVRLDRRASESELEQGSVD